MSIADEVAGYENARKVAALSAAILCCNLHREVVVDDQTPFFIAEFRKRLCKSHQQSNTREIYINSRL